MRSAVSKDKLTWLSKRVRLIVLVALLPIAAPHGALGETIYMVALGLSRMELDGSNAQLLFGQLPNSFFEDVAVNTTSGTVYFIEATTVGGGTIVHRYDPGGSRSFVVGVLGFRTITTVTVDESAGKLYYSIVSPEVQIRRCGLSGQDCETFASGLDHVLSMDVDSSGGRIYWSEYDWTSHVGSIKRASLPFGQNREVVLSSLGMPVDIVIDEAGGKIYWVDQDSAKVQRANLDGSTMETLADVGANTLSSISLDRMNGKIFWIHSNTGDVEQSNLDGTGRQTAFNFWAARRFDIGPDGLVGVEKKSWGNLKTLYR